MESACGTCKQIVNTVTEATQALEETLAAINPAWVNTTIWTVVTTAVSDILQITSILCPDFEGAKKPLLLVAPRIVAGDCLNASQTQELTKAIAGIQAALETVYIGLEIGARFQTDPNTKQELLFVATAVNAVSKQLVANLTAIVQSACGNCTEIVSDIQLAATVLEDTLASIDPAWPTDPLWAIVVDGINQILGYVSQLCPDAQALLFRQHAKAVNGLILP